MHNKKPKRALKTLKKISPILFITMILIWGLIQKTSAKIDVSLSLDPIPNQIRAVRFDPSYYYDSSLKIDEMCNKLATKWQNFGVNTVYFKAYDPIYGAKYKTSYKLNKVSDYGKQDLLKHMIRACLKNKIKVFAWIPAFQHKTAWEKHPEWRVKLSDGSDYKPTEDSYFLCPANPEVREWWLGFLKDLLKHYKDLDGVDIAEPIITWKGHRCFCQYCENSAKQEGDNFTSANGLTETLAASVELIHKFNKTVCITTVASVHPDGRVATIEEQKQRTGFDLKGVLSANDKPDWISFEFMWQQWAQHFNEHQIFTPEWIKNAVKTILNQVDGRTKVIGHLELTSFGQIIVDAKKLLKSIYIAKEAGLEHIDLYDTHLIDKENAWEAVKDGFEFVPTKNILVCYDSHGENDAKQVASLLSHFRADIQLKKITDEASFTPNYLEHFDVIFCVGVYPKFKYPQQFLAHILSFKGTLCWIHYGIDQLLSVADVNRFGFRYNGAHHDSTFNIVSYKGFSLPRLDPAFNEISITDSTKCHQLAQMTNGTNDLPYVIRNGNLWYFADLPTAFVTEGGRHIVFSDLLHDIVREDHKVRRLALVRIEDICPLTDTESIKRIADYLKSQKVPFSVALVPFYLDPESNTAVAMSERPDFVNAIQHMIKSGGTIIIHGSTHQYRGETTADYEFWDGMSELPLFADSKEYVRQRLVTGLEELGKNKIYPLAWETPHYGASQMDYSIINTFFSTAYERRQTMDLHGSDQLLPYLIYNHTAGGKIIPENLGYIPLSQPDARPMLQAANNYLAIRDGVASFFFHPFVKHSVLKDLIVGLKRLGYEFSSPRLTSNWVKAPDFVVLSGSGEIELDLSDEYFHEFFLDENGHIKNETYSDSTMVGKVSKQVNVPQGWIYVAERITEKPKSFWARTLNHVMPSAPKLMSFILGTESKPLEDVDALPIRAAVLQDSTRRGPLAIDQANFIEALNSVGVDVRIFDVSEFFEVPKDINLMIVPYSAAQALSEQQTLFLVHALQNGLNLILEKNSDLSRNIGIVPLERVVTVKEVVDEYFPQVGIVWREPDSLQEFDVDIDYVSYYSDKKTELPIVIGGEYGEGKYLYFATYFDPHTKGGYGRFPYFIDLLKRQFNLVPTVRRNAVEIYFEPGEREDISIEDLIKIWRSNGVRKIYVSAWHFYRDYTYDYERLIELAHQNAMLVYAWLELPHVSDKFWLDHPEWREKTAVGHDARVGWRKHMALNVEACRQAVFNELRTILTSYDWDGVNIADLYYESPLGYQSPEMFTPMNNEIRKVFAQQSGFDPKLLFNPKSKYYWKHNPSAMAAFDQFREDQIVLLHRQFLRFFHQLAQDFNFNWELIVTTLDNISAPKAGKGVGINTLRLIELSKEYPFTLQLEDPQTLLSLGPARYTKMLATYSGITQNIPLILNINIVSDRRRAQCMAPTAQPTGIELYQSARVAGVGNPRIAIHSEASLYEVDFPMLPYVMASDVVEETIGNKWKIDGPYSVNFLVDIDEHSDILVDGRIWPAYHRGRVLLPAGKHLIQPISKIKSSTNRFKSNTRLVDLSGELLSAKTISRGIKFEYDSQVSNWVILTDEPKQILIDGQKINKEIVRSELGFSIRLPAGAHKATIYTQSSGTRFLKNASILISGMIVLIGLSAGTLLFIIYIKSSIRRRHNLV